MHRLLVLVGCMLCFCVRITGQHLRTGDLPALRKQLGRVLPDTTRLQVLLTLSNTFTLLPGEKPHDLDTALLLANQALQTSRLHKFPVYEALAYLAIARAFREKADTAQARMYQKKTIALAQAHAWHDILGEAWLESSWYEQDFTGAGLALKINCYQQAFSNFELAGNTGRMAFCLEKLGDMHSAEGRLALAQAELLRALNLYRALHFPALQGVYDLLGANEADLGNYEAAIQYGRLAEQTANAQRDSGMLCSIYNRQGLTFQDMGDVEDANACFQRSLEVALRQRDTANALIVAWNIEGNLTRQGRYEAALAFLRSCEVRFTNLEARNQMIMASLWVNAYVLYKKPLPAQPYLRKMLQLADGIPKNNYAREPVYRAAIRYFLLDGNYHAASKYCMDYEALCKLTGNSLALSDNYLWRFKVDSATGNFSSAIRQYQQYRTIRDSLFGDNRTLFAAKYEVAAKEKDLQLKEQNIAVLTRQGQVQKSKLEKTQLVKVIIMAGIIVLVFIILILLYNRYRFRKQSYRQLCLQQQEISLQNNSLQSLMATQHKLLGEKEWLLKEIHHRVKNNLQIVMSLLNTQSAHLQNDAAISAIHESRRRMQAISLIHQKLYQNENVSVVDMDGYIHELVEYVLDGFPDIHTIYFDICITPIALDVSQAVPIGLILNEALTNAIKYAFDKSRAGVITITMDHLPNRDLLLTVSDNGKGLPPGFDIDKNGAMGFTLIQTLCRQLNGTLELRDEEGVAVMITFTPPR